MMFVVFAGAAAKRKRWSTQNFAQIADYDPSVADAVAHATVTDATDLILFWFPGFLP